MALGATLIGHDRYYRDIPQPRGHNFDEPSALDTERLLTDLDRVRQGLAADLPVYDFATHRRQRHAERVVPASVVIVEGILVLASPELVARMDFTVYVDCADDVRLERRLRRDVDERGREWRDVLRQWAETVRPAHRRWVEPAKHECSLILDGEAGTESQVARLASAVVQARAGRIPLA